jgi:hypothetical protein
MQILGFCSGVVDIFILQGCGAESRDIWFLIFRDNNDLILQISKCPILLGHFRP